MKNFFISLLFLAALVGGIMMETPGAKFPLIELGILVVIIFVLFFLASRRYHREGADETFGDDD